MIRKHRLLMYMFLLLPMLVWAQEEFPLFTKDFPPEEFAQRRDKVFDAIGENAVAVIQGAESLAGFVRFRQTNTFYYLSGIESPHAYLLLDGSSRRTSLYLPHRQERRERSEGKVLSVEDAELVAELSGISAVFAPEDLSSALTRIAMAGNIQNIYTPFRPAEGRSGSRDMNTRRITDIASDPWDGRISKEAHFIELLKTRLPQLTVRDLSPVLDQLRLIKSPREIALLRTATRLSGLALMEAMRSVRPGMKEYELDGMAKFIYFRNGANAEAYFSLIASGTNAYFPHYNAGQKTMRDGELLLMDYSPEVGYYTADVTRMMPINGKFNKWQRELYGFYVGCYRAILDNIRPNVQASLVKQEAAAEMERILASSRFSKPIYEKAATAFVERYKASANRGRGSLGHGVGMAVHDVGRSRGILEPGMVFTIEPALRVPEEQIYIRLEDMIAITEDGAELMSDFVPMDIDGIEKLMREEGILQKYPLDKSLTLLMQNQ